MLIELIRSPSIDLLLSKEPTNMQAQSLNSLIEAGVAKGLSSFSFRPFARTSSLPMLTHRLSVHVQYTEGSIGMAIAGGVVAVVGVLAAGIFRSARNHK
jgi:hypothetical protein